MTFAAAILDISTWLGGRHVLVTHMSGMLAKTGAKLGEGDLTQGFEMLGFGGAFFAGALTSGFWTSRPEWKNLSTCSNCLLLVGGMNFAVAALTDNEQATAGAYVAAYSAGLQNAMLTTITGFLRTTHVTGTVTDVGLLVGQGIPLKFGDKAHWWKTRVLAIGIVVWLAGGLVARVLWDNEVQDKLAYVAASFSFVLGVLGHVHIYTEHMMERRKVAQEEEEEEEARRQEAAESGDSKSMEQKNLSFKRVSLRQMSKIGAALEALEEISRGIAGNINSMPDPPERVVGKAMQVHKAAKLFKSKSGAYQMRVEFEKKANLSMGQLSKFIALDHPELLEELHDKASRQTEANIFFSLSSFTFFTSFECGYVLKRWVMFCFDIQIRLGCSTHSQQQTNKQKFPKLKMQFGVDTVAFCQASAAVAIAEEDGQPSK